MKIRKLASLLKQKNNIILVTHKKPDGDAIASLIAFHRILKKIKIKSEIFISESIPKNLNFLIKKSDTIKRKINSKYKSKQTIICLDLSDLSKLEEKTLKSIEKIKEKEFIFIDHHNAKKKEENSFYFTFPNASSTGEIIYDLIKKIKIKVSKTIATLIYAAIVSDTRSFKYSKTTKKSHKIAEELISLGLNTEKIQTKIFSHKTLNQIKLLGYILLNTKLSKTQKIAYTSVNNRILKKYRIFPEETKGFVNNLLNIKTTEFGVLFREDTKGKFKVSIRSKGKYSLKNFNSTKGKKFAYTTTIPNKESQKKDLIKKLEALIK
jgi:bifunctional oligoribonuclease and PAP phosphatase NrnA